MRDRSRSPRFPSYPLEEALSFAAKIYDGAHRAPIDPETAYQLMGFKGRSGASATALGAIRQFGLIEGLSDRTRISDLALRIFEPESPSEKSAALNEAAGRPEVFQALLGRYAGSPPTADEPIRAYLIRELGFSKSGADQCLDSFRATMSLLSALPSSNGGIVTPASEDVRTPEPSIVRAAAPKVSMAHTQRDSASIPDFVFHLGGGRVAVIEINGGSITSRHLARLGRFIQLQGKMLAEEEQDFDDQAYPTEDWDID